MEPSRRIDAEPAGAGLRPGARMPKIGGYRPQLCMRSGMLCICNPGDIYLLEAFYLSTRYRLAGQRVLEAGFAFITYSYPAFSLRKSNT